MINMDWVSIVAGIAFAAYIIAIFLIPKEKRSLVGLSTFGWSQLRFPLSFPTDIVNDRVEELLNFNFRNTPARPYRPFLPVPKHVAMGKSFFSPRKTEDLVFTDKLQVLILAFTMIGSRSMKDTLSDFRNVLKLSKTMPKTQ